MELIMGQKGADTVHDLAIKIVKPKQRFGKFLSEMRLKSAMTYEDIESQTSFSPSLVQSWELGFRIPNIKDLQIIIELFGRESWIEFNMLSTELMLESRQFYSEVNSPNIG